ncbi:MAG TPA: hypothetical protein VGL35_04245 [Rhizomicrobium sp.]|jgi:hypothetical protein
MPGIAMNRQRLLVFAAIVGLLGAGPAAAKPYLYPITAVPNSILTTIFGINDKGIATGSWYDPENVEHGYIGSPDGSKYTTFDDQTDPGTEPRGLNDANIVTGFDNSQSGSADSYIPFERASDGTITDLAKKGVTLNDLIQGINKNGVFTGSYATTSLQIVGYTGKNAKFTGGIKLKGITNTGVAGRGIDAAGDIVGWYYDASGAQHGFLLPAGRNPTTINSTAKNTVSTVLESINDKGLITGQYTDTSGDIHGFIYDIAQKAFREIKVPGAASFVQAWGINNKGWVAVGSDAGYFVYCPSFSKCVGTAAPYRAPKQKLHPQLP